MNFDGEFNSSGGVQAIGSNFNSNGGDINIGSAYNNSRCLHDLLLTDPRLDKERIEANKDRLLEGSCSWVLEDPAFLEWWQNDDPNVLWIRGDAGKGKTMMTIALISEITKRLTFRPESGILSYFFCQSTSADLNGAVAVLRGLVYQLVIQERSLLHILQKRYDEAGKRLFEGSNALYALRGILKQLVQESSYLRIYLVVDGLDECDFELDQLLEVIFDNGMGSKSRVKWLVTSRNDIGIEEAIINESHLCTSLELNSDHVVRAVHAFIEFKVAALAKRKKYNLELSTFVREQLFDKAEGTFLWVALVCKTLEKAQRRQIASLLATIPPGLGHLYDRMWKKLEEGHTEDVKTCRKILCTIIPAFRPLHLGEIQAIIEEIDPEDLDTCRELVEACGSFITVRDDVVYFVHQSAKDYFTVGPGQGIISSTIATLHELLARRCVQLMTESLKRNMCGLRHPGVFVDEVPKTTIDQNLVRIQYSCQYWLRHVLAHHNSKTTSIDLNDGGYIDVFLQAKFLYWLETLSLLRKISEGVSDLLKLLPILSDGRSPRVLYRISDFKRFVLHSISGIEQAPLQVYNAALVFSPESSYTRQHFLSEGPAWVKKWPKTAQVWSACVSTLGHSGQVTAVSFSPNGQLIASASSRETIVRLWDTYTGALRSTLEGHSRSVNAVSFSPNGQLVASASDDMIVRLWDTRTGALRSTLEGHSGQVTAVSFSPNGQLVASASDDMIVQLWDAQTGALRSTLKGHSGRVRAVAFSPNSQLIVSASYDSIVRLWDTQTGALRSPLEGHSGWVTAVSFSPNGQLIASASSKETIVRLWDTHTGALRSTLEGHSRSVNAVSFSPNGQLVASASDDMIVRLWDAQTGDLRSTLEGHSSRVRAVAFSPNSQLIVSASYDSIVRLRDTHTGALQSTLEGHSGWVTAVSFSPNGQLVASASDDMTVRLWDAQTGSVQSTLEANSNTINAITTSPDGQVIASTLDEMRRHMAEMDARRVRTIAISTDNRRFASATYDHMVQLWDTETGFVTQTYPVGRDVHWMFFSQGGSRLIISDRRIIDIEHLPDLEHPLLTPLPARSESSYRLEGDGSWISWNNHKVLWLPMEYRPSCSLFKDDILLIGSNSGRVIFFRFDLSISPMSK